MAETGGATSPARFYLFFLIFFCCYFYVPREAAFFVVGVDGRALAAAALRERRWRTRASLAELLVILPTFAVLGGLIAVSKSLTVRLREESLVLAMTDELTGISNRRAFEAAIDAIVGGQRAGDGTGLLLVDLDDFKDGQHALRPHRRRPRAVWPRPTPCAMPPAGTTWSPAWAATSSRSWPTASRESGMRRLADRLFECMRRADDGLSLDGFDLSASAGWAVFPTQAANSTELFERADHALAQAKIGGKGAWKSAPTGRSRARLTA